MMARHTIAKAMRKMNYSMTKIMVADYSSSPFFSPITTTIPMSSSNSSSSSNNNTGTGRHPPTIIPTTPSRLLLLRVGGRLQRSHYTYAGPGRFSAEATEERHLKRLQFQSWYERGFTVGIGGPVGSGKTALVLALIKRLASRSSATTTASSSLNVPASPSSESESESDSSSTLHRSSNTNHPLLGVVTNDIFTQEDAQFLHHNQTVLDANYIKAIETGGCPHAAIREDISSNLTACEELTRELLISAVPRNIVRKNLTSLLGVPPPLILCESGGDNLAANFSNELADLTLYIIDVAGGDKIPRKGGPGITQSDLLIINKIDLAEAVGASLEVMARDANVMRNTNYNNNMHISSSNGDNDHHSHDHSSHDHDHNHDQGEKSTATTTTTAIGPTVFASVRDGIALDDIEKFILDEYYKATSTSATSATSTAPSTSSSSTA